MPLLAFEDLPEVIIFVVHFMFAVVVMETITTAPEFEEDAIVQNLFGSLFYTMFTLFQFMTFDSWAIVARPVSAKRESSFRKSSNILCETEKLWFTLLAPILALANLRQCCLILISFVITTQTKVKRAEAGC